MYDLRNKEEKKQKIDWLKYIFYFWRNKYKILLTIIILMIIIFPTFSGTAIGDWITNFLGNIIPKIKEVF